MRVDVKVEATGLLSALKQLSGRDMSAAVNRAVQRAGTTLKTETSKEVRKTYALKAKNLGGRILHIEKAPKELAVQLRISGQQIPLGDFGNPKQGPKGTRVTVKRGSRTLYPRAFIATLKGGAKPNVYWRVRDGNKLVPRGPLQLLMGPAVAQVVSNPGFIAKLQGVASRRLTEVLKQEIKFRTDPNRRTPARFKRGSS